MAHPPPPFFATPSLHNEALELPALAPSYMELYGKAWMQWETVDQAYQRVAKLEAALSEIEPVLSAKTKECGELKAKSSNLFASLHSRSILPRALKRIHSDSSAREVESKQRRREEFEAAHGEETALMSHIEQLRGRVDSLKAEIQSNAELASTVDHVFELLRASVAESNANNLDDPLVMEAEDRLLAGSTSLELAQQAVSDLTRARVTVQHAHHYYTDVLKTIDAVRGTGLGRAVIGGFGEMSKNLDYQVAVETAAKAQVCFNETVRVLSPHAATLPPEVFADFEKLKELGLLQASKIYGLMYGWKHSTAGVSKSVNLMLQKQEDAFARLTRLAVWVQDRVPVVEGELLASRASRDTARRALAAAWKTNAVGADPSRYRNSRS